MIHKEENGTELWMAFLKDNDAALVAHPHGRLIALMCEVEAA